MIKKECYTISFENSYIVVRVSFQSWSVLPSHLRRMCPAQHQCRLPHQLPQLQLELSSARGPAGWLTESATCILIQKGGPSTLTRSSWSSVSSPRQVRLSLISLSMSCVNTLSSRPLAIGRQNNNSMMANSLVQPVASTALKSFHQITL